MIDRLNPSTKLILEEKKAIKLFLWLFYSMYMIFDLYYYFVYPYLQHKKEFGFPNEGLGMWIYVLIFGLLFPGIYNIKKGNPFIVKYVYLIGFVLITLTDDLIVFLGDPKPYSSGNIVEILFIVFSPIFVNKKYYFVSSLMITCKYLLLLLVLQDTRIVPPLVVYLIIMVIAFVITVRFQSYIKSLMKVQDDLYQKEKLATIGQMATAIAHEIRNPLASLKGFTQLQYEKSPNLNEYYPIMIQEIDRINLIVNDLMYLGKPKTIQFEKANIEEVIAYTLSIMKQPAQSQGVEFKTIMEGPLPQIDCDRNQLKQVFINLVKNAIEAMPKGGKILINLKAVNENHLLISIHDEGCGISDEDIKNLVEPFYTNKKDGTGLGLMVTKQIIGDHQGKLEFYSEIGVGTEVKVILPITQKQNSLIKVS
jgi:signal transduction histidine kinase